MKRTSFCSDWLISHKDENDWRPVGIPHDAMLEEKRTYSAFGHNNGFFEGKDYLYRKEFRLDPKMLLKQLLLEFEGVYHNSSVIINGKEMASFYNGYIGFCVDISDVAQEQNVIEVIVRNADQPNSRWYTGSGIYRPVWLWYADKQHHIVKDSVRIKTVSLEPAVLEIRMQTVGTGDVLLTICDGLQAVCSASGFSDGEAVLTVQIPQARLWSAQTPDLYTAKIRFGEDTESVSFGIRTIELHREKGLLINGKREILKGACIHADNGLLGAKEYDCAAERKIRILKTAGYNAVRSSHQPMSKALLNACDKLGMYVMDEYTDMWYIHKNRYDDASFVPDHFREDIRCITEKDYNHPSVILYSSGNEVAETCSSKGIAFTKTLTECFHANDDTRPVTAGINIFFNFLSSIGLGFYSDEKAEQALKESPIPEQKPKKKKAAGSEFFNNLAGFFGSDTMKLMAWFPFCDWATKGAFANMDVAGYNYGITRYKKDLRKYPNRFILGSESFLTDAAAFEALSKKNPRILGDFAWAGMDYIGEVALGSLDYADYAKDFEKTAGWLTSGSGCFDITGQAQGHTAYTQVVYDKRAIAVAVQPADHSGEAHMTSAWRKIHAFESWSWNGCDGHETTVEVYTKAPRAALVLNGQTVAAGKVRSCRARFRIPYTPGELVAIAFDSSGKELYRTALQTAGEETILTLTPEKARIRADELLFVRLQFTDHSGILKPLARSMIHVAVGGGELLALGSACPYNEQGYLCDTTDTYYGEALAIIRPADQEICVRAESAYGNSTITVPVEEAAPTPEF
ncbi:MAG: DUF4982 domain-containing protein [Clostridia bacterium]|nr:DUF4982 domain-containing protein [Clostridia bacterium]